ncbi:polyphenol oxidase family protein [Calidifontibacter terrae]
MSGAGWSSLNLGAHVGDDPSAVAENRRRVAHEMRRDESQLRFMSQVHGNEVAVLPQAVPPTCDAQISDSADDLLVVLVADCTPVLLYDTQSPLIAAVHSGRPGMTAGVVPAAVRRLRELGARDLQAVVGPSVCGRCYEVPAQMRDAAAAVAPASAAVSWSGTPAIDVAAGVVSQLHADEVPLTWVAGCTRENEQLFSHRRDPGAGRFAGVIGRRPR